MTADGAASLGPVCSCGAKLGATLGNAGSRSAHAVVRSVRGNARGAC